MDGKLIGGNVKQARRAAGFSQEELARRLGVSVFSVSAWERGAVKSVSLERLQRIADELGVQTGVLLGTEAS